MRNLLKKINPYTAVFVSLVTLGLMAPIWAASIPDPVTKQYVRSLERIAAALESIDKELKELNRKR